MGDSLTNTLIELMELPAPSGQEEPVLNWCRTRWADAGGEVSVSPVGNVLARFSGKGPRLLMQGHADEIGFIVKSIDDDGFLRITDAQASLRNMVERYPIGQPALVVTRNGTIDGLFATATGHILSTKRDGNRTITPGKNDIFVDIGAGSRQEAIDRGIHIGAGIIWNPPVRRIGTRIVGKAIDDRVSLALMTHLVESVDIANLAYDLTIAATVQEEIGLIGATALGGANSFDLAISIDNGPTADYPGVSLDEVPVELEKGPALIYKDAMVHYDRRILDRLTAIANEEKIPVQPCMYTGFASDGVALSKSGIPTALVVVPSRYTHSPFEMSDESDLESTLALLTAFVSKQQEDLPPGPS